MAGRELTGSVHSWDVSTGVDGPGTRFALFLAGCPLRCLYCQNPDTWHERNGTRLTVPETLATIEPYRRFIATAGGGVTATGGEPLLQARFVAALFRALRAEGLHTALDTSGYLGGMAGDALLADTSLVLLDIKAWRPATYRRLTGGEIDPTLAFARRLDALGVPTRVRYVLVPGFTDRPEEVAGVADFVAGLSVVERVEVLPYHRLGEPKYAELGLRYPLPDTGPPAPAITDAVRAAFRERGLVTV